MALVALCDTCYNKCHKAASSGTGDQIIAGEWQPFNKGYGGDALAAEDAVALLQIQGHQAERLR